jgi:hypothetical protein
VYSFIEFSKNRIPDSVKLEIMVHPFYDSDGMISDSFQHFPFVPLLRDALADIVIKPYEIR